MDRITRPPIVGASLTDYIQSAFNAWVRSILGIQSAHGQKISELEAALASGAAFSDNFNRPDAPLLGNGWIQGGVGEFLGIIDYAARVNNPGLVGVDSGRRWARAPINMSKNDHAVSAIVNPKGVAQSVMTSLFIRANTDLTEFVYVNAYRHAIYMGRGTRSGNTWTFTDWVSKTSDFQLYESDVLELVAVGNEYRVLVNSTLQLIHTDSSGYPIDTSHRYVGFASETKIVNLLPQHSWGLAAFTARTIDFTSIAQVAEKATEANDAALSAVDAVARLTSELDSGDTQAEQYHHSFEGDGTNDLGPLWVTPGSTAATQLILDNNRLWADPGSPFGIWGTRYVDPMPSDDVSVSIVLGSNGATEVGTYIILRSNADLSNCAVIFVLPNAVGLGYGGFGPDGNLINGSFTQLQYSEFDVNNGSTVVASVVGNTYSVKVNGLPVFNFTDANNYRPGGVNNRYWGISVGDGQNFWGFNVASFAVSSINARDISPTLKVGTGWKLFRSNTSSVSAGSSGYRRVPSTTYDTQRELLNVTLHHLGSGVVKIDRSGWYHVRVRLQTSSSSGEDGQMRALLYAGTDPSLMELIEVGQGVEGDFSFSCDLSTPVYLHAGTYVAPGLSSSNSNSIVGDALATVTVFTGALMSGR